jgi:hypothetical protein
MNTIMTLLPIVTRDSDHTGSGGFEHGTVSSIPLPFRSSRFGFLLGSWNHRFQPWDLGTSAAFLDSLSKGVVGLLILLSSPVGWRMQYSKMYHSEGLSLPLSGSNRLKRRPSFSHVLFSECSFIFWMHLSRTVSYVAQPKATSAFRLKTIMYVMNPISTAAMMKGVLVEESVIFGIAHNALRNRQY